MSSVSPPSPLVVSGSKIGAVDLAGSWKAAVVANGGTVSAARLALITTLIAAYQAAGWWQVMDDAWLLVAENTQSALTSLKRLVLATVTAAPTFTTDRGYAFNGSTQYINTGLIPNTMCSGMTTQGGRLAVYERTNVSANTCAFGVNDGSNKLLEVFPRSSSLATLLAMQAGAATLTLSVADSRGLRVASRSYGVNTLNGYVNGVALTGLSNNLNTGITLPTIPIFIGARNATSPSLFRAATEGYADIGGPLTATQELAVYNALQAFMVAVGANV